MLRSFARTRNSSRPSSLDAASRMPDGSGAMNVMLSNPGLDAPLAAPVRMRVFRTPSALVGINEVEAVRLFGGLLLSALSVANGVPEQLGVNAIVQRSVCNDTNMIGSRSIWSP